MPIEENNTVQQSSAPKVIEIKRSCENLINQTQFDLEIFMHEQIHLRKQIEDILTENKTINTKLESLKTATVQIAGDSRDDATREKFTNDALLNVKKQIDFLEAENKELKLLNNTSRKRIQNLENEIQGYRNHLCKSNTVTEVKQKYDIAIKVLESTIQTQKTKITSQAQIIDNLTEQKKQLGKHIKNLERTLEEKQSCMNNTNATETIERLRAKLNESVQQTKELQLSLKMAKNAIEERYEREKCALQKVQEALSIAEAAVVDKEDAQKRERVVKEECDNLASTIGQVMDEAAKKVETDMDALRKRFSEKENKFLKFQMLMREELQKQKKFNRILETQCSRFQDKYTASKEEVEKLSKQLESAVKALDEMEDKINEQDHLLKEQKIIMRRADENEEEIQRYVHTNKKLTEKYKTTLADIRREFEGVIYSLKKEITVLKAEKHLSSKDYQQKFT